MNSIFHFGKNKAILYFDLMQLRRALFPAFLGITLFYLISPLGFVPVPWPDDSAFFLPGIQWIKWGGKFAMHAQAPFVPSYDHANFNTMPGMPLLLGLGYWFGIKSAFAIRLYGMIAFALWAATLYSWLRVRNVSRWLRTLLTLAAVTSPILRWGSMVVRPEIYQGLFFTWMLLELTGDLDRISPFKLPKKAWRLPLLLAASAYAHFEGVYWVPAIALGVLLSTPRTKLLDHYLSITWRTVLLLTPWLLYVAVHWSDFLSQMQTQFGRLDNEAPCAGWHCVFHSLYLKMGNPVEFPKFYNLGKGLNWGLLLAVVIAPLVLLKKYKLPSFLPLAMSSFATLFTYWLWWDKPETWFTTLIHLSLWVGTASLALTLKTFGQRILGAVLSLLLLIHVGVAFHQYNELKGLYTWKNYTAWTDCIETRLGSAQKIWQPHWPDILVQLSGRAPDKDYTRAVDFKNIDPLIQEHALSRDVIVHSLYLPREAAIEQPNLYSGTARKGDHYWVTEYPWVPFKNYAAPSTGWRFETCHIGPFWAGLSFRAK